MLEALLKKIISKSFKYMVDTPISIKFANVLDTEDAYCIYYSHCKKISQCKRINKFVIDIDWSLEKNKNAIIGAIAHELCHIEWELLHHDNYYKKDYKMYQEYFPHRRRDEVYTDLQTILKGYGKELLELMKHYEKYPTKEYYQGLYCGMKIKDIKKLIS